MEFLFWISALLFISSWLLYPLALALICPLFRRFSRDWPEMEEWPSVSVLIAARNEEAVIAHRIDNLLNQDYRGEMEILIGSDCSRDATDSIVESYSGRGVRLFRSESRVGKPVMLRNLQSICNGDILVLTDADTVFQSNTVTQLVLPYSDPSVGCVDGCRRNSLEDETCESVYWKYEKTVKELCSCLGAVLGATGAVFSLRKSLYLPLTENRADDFELAVMTRLQGKACVYNENAVAMEPSPGNERQYRRMVRIVSWMMVSAFHLMFKALRRRRVMLFLQLTVHKLLRWLSGLFLAVCTVMAGLLSGNAFYLALFVLLSLFHLLAAAGWLMGNRFPSKLLFPYYFWLMNGAALNGILRTLTGNPVETWEKKRGQD